MTPIELELQRKIIESYIEVMICQHQYLVEDAWQQTMFNLHYELEKVKLQEEAYEKDLNN